MKKLLIYILTFAAVNIHARAANAQSSGKSFLFKNDTLYSRIDSCQKVNSNPLKVFYGLKLSSSYMIIDTLRIDLNEDGAEDWILILSPQIQEKNQYKESCYYSDFNKRLLVTLISNNRSYSVQTINENIILNKEEYPSEPFRRIVKENGGFALQFFIGSSRKCYYNFSFQVTSNGCYMRNSQYECYLIDLSKHKKDLQSYKRSPHTELGKIDIRKFIKLPKL